MSGRDNNQSAMEFDRLHRAYSPERCQSILNEEAKRNGSQVEYDLALAERVRDFLLAIYRLHHASQT